VSEQSVSLPAAGESSAPVGAGSPTVLLRRLVLVATLVCLLAWSAVPALVAVLDWRLPDNDDAMRVLQVRDLLAGQSWWDVSQHRLAPLDGGNMHWSRLGDLPLAGLTILFDLAVPGDLALKLATFTAPVLLGVVYLALIVRACWLVGGQAAATAGIALGCLAFSAIFYFMPGRVDHHGLQLVLMTGALVGLLSGGWRGALAAGVCVAASLLIGLETAPVLVVFTGWVVLRWLFRPVAAQWTSLAYAAGLWAGLAGLFAATVPVMRWQEPAHDALSVIHLVPALTGAAGLMALALLCGRWTFAQRAGAVAGLGALVIVAALRHPQILLAPYDLVDPLLMDLWLSRVAETFSALAAIRTGAAHSAVAFGIPVLLAAAAAIWMAREALLQRSIDMADGASPSPGEDKALELDRWLLLVAGLVVAGALAWLWQLRVSGQASAIGAVACAGALSHILARRGARAMILAGLLITPLWPGVAGAMLSRFGAASQPEAASGALPSRETGRPQTSGSGPAMEGPRCTGEDAFAAVADVAPALAVTTVDTGAPLLLATHHSALAAPYHRNNASILAAYRVWMAPAGEARRRAASLGADLLVFCDGAPEVAVLSERAPAGLIADLSRGQVPDWLRPLPAAAGSDIKAFMVVR
jgi:hypothetical protein